MLFVFAALTVTAAIWVITAPQSPQDPTYGQVQSAHRVGFHPVKRLVFVALAVDAIIWGSTAGTLRPSAHEHHLAVKDVSLAPAWPMTEPVAAPDLSVHVG